jgi:Putative restriction endonuclease
VTAEEFLAWETPDGSDQWELIDGVPVAWQPLSDRAGSIAADAAGLIGNRLLGRRPLQLRIQPAISPNAHNVRTPTLAVSAETPAPSDVLLHEPLVIVEVVCHANAENVRTAVPRYLAMPGVREVLVLLSGIRDAALWRRPAAGGDWARTTLAGEDEVRLPSIGFAAPLPAFYRTADA